MIETKTTVASRALSRGMATLRATAMGLAALALLGASANAGNMYQPSTITAGGVPAQATQNAPVLTSSNCTFSWYGMRGWSSIYGSTNASGPFSTFIGSAEASDYAWSVVANNPDTTNNWFFVLAQTNYYAGSAACASCHGDKYAKWIKTGHASAIGDILQTDGTFTSSHANASCLPCHTVGYGQTSGYVYTSNSAAYSSMLANVGCEDCHGPAGWHKNSDHDVIRPALTVASEVCGGCHNGHNPQYTEWATSPHAEVVPDFAAGISDTFSGQSRGIQCGPCHSAAMRISMLNNYNDRLKGFTNVLAIPTVHDVTNYAQTCVVCHDPHSPTFVSTNWVFSTNTLYVTNIYSDYGIYHTNVTSSTTVSASSNVVAIPFQLRNPMNSTNYYTFFTATPTATTVTTNFAGVVTRTTNYLADAFTAQYDPNVQICAQCHNGRGARWDGIGRSWNGTNLVPGTASWSRGPHPADQYNVLIGILQPDYLNVNASGVATNYYAAHSGLQTRSPYNTNQCSTCHVPIYTSGGTNISGHSFVLDTKGCALGGCHLSGVPDWEGYQEETKVSITNVVNLLNQWATNNGPTLFGTNYSKYLQNGWEYTTIGALATITNAGPSSGDQTKMPNAIKQARFNAYMVQGDGSFGVHNPGYVTFLLKDAVNKVTGQLNPAYFAAGSTTVFSGASVQFTTYGTGITSYAWDFGDGTTDTVANPSHVFTVPSGTTPVTNTVSLTVTTSGGPTTYTRTNYIVVGVPPVPAFTANVTTGTHPLTVTFTNLTPALPAVSAWRWTVMGGVSGSPTLSTKNPTFTYTNAGTYNVYLRATAVGGTVTVTNNAFIIVQ